jgi:beta-phosphoglucomutase
MPKYEAILFDFDGVLLDSEPAHFACWREVLAPLGITVDWDTYREHCIGVADYTMLEFLARRASPPVAAERLWAEYSRKNGKFLERMASNPPFPQQTRRLIEDLSDYKLAVVSSSARAEVEPVLAAAGLRRCFDAVVYGEDVERLKPAPEPYLLAAKRLGISTALVVEDSDPGVASGRAAGFDVLRIDHPERLAELVRERLALH